MKTLPFIIQRIVFKDEPALQSISFDKPDDHPAQLVTIEDSPPSEATIPGYFVMSSAPPNIDEKSSEPTVEAQRAKIRKDNRNAALGIEEIAQRLCEVGQQGRNPELIITVHGYNTSRSSVQNWYKDIFLYINRYDAAIARHGTQVFLGYRWPSENIELQRLGEALKALPPLPRDLLIFGLLCGLAMFILEFTTFQETPYGFVLTLILALFLLLGFIMLTLVLLRLVVYFRDRYRADNFGVLDLVELLRQIDRHVIRLKAQDILSQHHPSIDSLSEEERQEAQRFAEDAAVSFWKDENRKIKLSFLGHSMGGFVVTNVIRILSDVFDARSVDKQPTPNVGSVFQLERLVLASPDIPVLTIISSRANFLASSLRRFTESYLLSSEGDIALRIASTAANYIAFPSRSQSRGYRLGNVALTKSKFTRSDKVGGIINLTTLDQQFYLGRPLAEAIAQTPDKVLENLFVTARRFKGKENETVADLFQQQTSWNHEVVTVADFFTFFDFTDYKDVTFDVKESHAKETAAGRAPANRPKGILTRARQADRLNALDYFLLTLDYVLGSRDVHGGYFLGQFSQAMTYRMLFLGFTGYLKTIDPDPSMAFDPHVALSKLHLKCRDMGIQGFLSPIRYRVDIQERPLSETIQELLNAIADESDAETSKKK
ncbi:MAG: alpha/beta hydrolase [Leptolyngbyaceae bacterium]|nr:alpha/beta hydrolase [Leptolyngbyaceae bacterium]